MSKGYRVATEDLAAQAKELSQVGEQTDGLVTSARQLADRMPMLGTAPPALHLAMRLRRSAGESGLAHEITAAHAALGDFHSALHDTATGYEHSDTTAADLLRGADSAT
ncbi:hypothetical protein REH65_10040 [Saccharopolyspora sp. ID03-671]|uniref:hypothetical protein n=1 Tax=Saccharopolyspora sp. ID03-671 TaxID=3073066 RepID=UPI003253F251